MPERKCTTFIAIKFHNRRTIDYILCGWNARHKQCKLVYIILVMLPTQSQSKYDVQGGSIYVERLACVHACGRWNCTLLPCDFKFSAKFVQVHFEKTLVLSNASCTTIMKCACPRKWTSVGTNGWFIRHQAIALLSCTDLSVPSRSNTFSKSTGISNRHEAA